MFASPHFPKSSTGNVHTLFLCLTTTSGIATANAKVRPFLLTAKEVEQDTGLRGKALQKDLVDQLPQWEEIAAMAPGPKITPLRALDIIGWELGNRRS